ncbi:hypothetical protein [Nocardiopsis lambiniae]|uniref:Uncharacterized protein n=1 Tax=Nocardiopsis lambiniae TaxID=3075539 RepID=A0ABU2M7I7_9ACTN|nr:hypothetical protein [Nocardiopsis sp. DSM 44743]MDT0328606.1 hypothetical protein [Nocardiopsis sp. DSM 44743]
MVRNTTSPPDPVHALPLSDGSPFREPPVPSSVGRHRFVERHEIPVRNPRPLGTNGYSNSWGTNAHGELSACPPGRR